MIREITLGQYYQSDSMIHKLDPRTKIIITMTFLISLFLIDSIWAYTIPLLFLLIEIRTSKVPFKFIVKGMRAIMMLLIITVIFNIFLTPGEPIFTFWKINITMEGIKIAIQMAIRLVFLIIGSSLMTLTTTPTQLTDGLEKLLRPLSYIKVPVHEIAMMMSIALRFIPILLEETDKIIKAQLARGADFESKNIIKKVKSYIPILVPLFISAFRRASDLALAMEARCYRVGAKRTKMKPLIYQNRDFISYAFILGYLGVIIVLNIYLKGMAQ